MTKHIHHDVIVAWAAGAEIEIFDSTDNKWIPCLSPFWNPQYSYRVRPLEHSTYLFWDNGHLSQDGRVDPNVKMTFDQSGKLTSINLIQNDKHTVNY